nr:ribonuclease-like storage protein [Ipomoea batatas]
MKIFAILFIFSVCIQKSYEQPWVGFHLTLYWPRGHCYTSRNCLYHLVTRNFTIHGLWPVDMSDQSPPIPPNNGNKYNNSLMYDDLKLKLSTMWRNYEPNKLDEDIWEDEWNNHVINGVKFSVDP